MRRNGPRAFRGTTLLEVVAALAILALVGTSFVELATQQLRVARTLHERESQMREAANVLARTAVWSPADLRARVGVTTAAGLRVEIALIARSMYSIAVLDGATQSVLLRTSRYASEDIGNAR